MPLELYVTCGLYWLYQKHYKQLFVHTHILY